MLEKIKANFSFQSLFWLVLILSIDALIFYFSSQPGAKSASQSGFVLNYFQIVDSLTTQKIIRKLVLILSIDALIFYFSSQPGAKSASQSGFVLNYFQIVDSLTTQKIIRKLAHFSIYACMGLCWTNFLCTLNLSLRHCFWISILMCFLFAAGDEWHQTFVPGRSGELFDVCLDTLCTLNLSLRHCFWISILMCFLFAAGDEWHQTFVPGRSGELFDVCLDTFGAILATSCTLWLHTHFFKTNNAQ